MRLAAWRLPRIRTRDRSEPGRSYPVRERRLGVSERQRTGKSLIWPKPHGDGLGNRPGGSDRIRAVHFLRRSPRARYSMPETRVYGRISKSRKTQ